jgi:hypothetical protein
VQTAAGVEPQIDMLRWVREYPWGAVYTQPMTLGDRGDGSDTTITFLGEVDAIAADVEITLAGGFSAAVISTCCRHTIARDIAPGPRHPRRARRATPAW